MLKAIDWQYWIFEKAGARFTEAFAMANEATNIADGAKRAGHWPWMTCT
jgi:hypothetical protein